MANSIYRGYEYGPSATTPGAYQVIKDGTVVKDNLAHDEAAMDWIDAERRKAVKNEG